MLWWTSRLGIFIIWLQASLRCCLPSRTHGTGNPLCYRRSDIRGYPDSIHVCLAHHHGGKSGLRHHFHFHVIPNRAIKDPVCRMVDCGDPDRPTDGYSWCNGIAWRIRAYEYAYRFDCHRSLCRPHHTRHKNEEKAVRWSATTVTEMSELSSNSVRG